MGFSSLAHLCANTRALFSSSANVLVILKKEKRTCTCCDSPRLQTLCFEWPAAAAPPLSWLAGEPADGSICTCLGCSGLWCSPCTRWPSSRCCPPCRPPSGERSGSRLRPSCSYRAGILGIPGGNDTRGNNFLERTQDRRFSSLLLFFLSSIESQNSFYFSIMKLAASGWVRNDSSTRPRRSKMAAFSFQCSFSPGAQAKQVWASVSDKSDLFRQSEPFWSKHSSMCNVVTSHWTVGTLFCCILFFFLNKGP